MAIYPRYTGEATRKYIYDRDRSARRNEPPAFWSFGGMSPDYGSSIKFGANINEIMFRDNWLKVTPSTLNGISAEFDFRFNNITNGQAAFLVNSLQQVIQETGSTSETMALSTGNPIMLEEGSETGMVIYNEMSGLMVGDYRINTRGDFINDVQIKLISNRLSSFLDYRGVYTNQSRIKTWATGLNFEEFDIVYYGGIFEDKRDNFFYCTSGHSGSLASQAPNLREDIWTQSMFFKPSTALNYTSSFNNDQKTYKKSFDDRVKMNKNSDLLNLSLTFDNRSNMETASILHFLENKMGYKPFDLSLSGIYKTSKAFYAPSWTHTFNYYDSNTITVDIKENPNGLFAKELNVNNFWSAPSE